jgi:putative FmdB family regulatory protein
MPRYEYRCRACEDTFEVSRPMAASAEVTPCPAGHGDTVKLLSTVALTGRGGFAASPSTAASSPSAGGGCCGGACGC